MEQLSYEIEINAEPEKVWSVLWGILPTDNGQPLLQKVLFMKEHWKKIISSNFLIPKITECTAGLKK
jgi:hypothetical protein